ncbi:hypothetical protein Pelo_10579 [Pelomyxa schiedti]|nr:hypothetical protein Pelo_10579 [Pelomyxa schiedti]
MQGLAVLQRVAEFLYSCTAEDTTQGAADDTPDADAASGNKGSAKNSSGKVVEDDEEEEEEEEDESVSRTSKTASASASASASGSASASAARGPAKMAGTAEGVKGLWVRGLFADLDAAAANGGRGGLADTFAESPTETAPLVNKIVVASSRGATDFIRGLGFTALSKLLKHMTQEQLLAKQWADHFLTYSQSSEPDIVCSAACVGALSFVCSCMQWASLRQDLLRSYAPRLALAYTNVIKHNRKFPSAKFASFCLKLLLELVPSSFKAQEENSTLFSNLSSFVTSNSIVIRMAVAECLAIASVHSITTLPIANTGLLNWHPQQDLKIVGAMHHLLNSLYKGMEDSSMAPAWRRSVETAATLSFGLFDAVDVSKSARKLETLCRALVSQISHADPKLRCACVCPSVVLDVAAHMINVSPTLLERKCVNATPIDRRLILDLLTTLPNIFSLALKVISSLIVVMKKQALPSMVEITYLIGIALRVSSNSWFQQPRFQKSLLQSVSYCFRVFGCSCSRLLCDSVIRHMTQFISSKTPALSALTSASNTTFHIEKKGESTQSDMNFQELAGLVSTTGALQALSDLLDYSGLLLTSQQLLHLAQVITPLLILSVNPYFPPDISGQGRIPFCEAVITTASKLCKMAIPEPIGGVPFIAFAIDQFRTGLCHSNSRVSKACADGLSLCEIIAHPRAPQVHVHTQNLQSTSSPTSTGYNWLLPHHNVPPEQIPRAQQPQPQPQAPPLPPASQLHPGPEFKWTQSESPYFPVTTPKVLPILPTSTVAAESPSTPPSKDAASALDSTATPAPFIQNTVTQSHSHSQTSSATEVDMVQQQVPQPIPEHTTQNMQAETNNTPVELPQAIPQKSTDTQELLYNSQCAEVHNTQPPPTATTTATTTSTSTTETESTPPDNDAESILDEGFVDAPPDSEDEDETL